MIYEIEKKSEDFKNVEFCFKALSKDKKDPRKHIHHFQIDEGFIISTNGRRLHKVKPIQEFQDGLYRPFKAEPGFVLVKVESFDYPEWKESFPEEDPDKIIGSSMINLDISLAEIIRKLPDQYTVSNVFIKDLLDNYFDIQFFIDKETLVFTSADGNKKAAIKLIKTLLS